VTAQRRSAAANDPTAVLATRKTGCQCEQDVRVSAGTLPIWQFADGPAPTTEDAAGAR